MEARHTTLRVHEQSEWEPIGLRLGLSIEHVRDSLNHGAYSNIQLDNYVLLQ